MKSDKKQDGKNPLIGSKATSKSMRKSSLQAPPKTTPKTQPKSPPVAVPEAPAKSQLQGPASKAQEHSSKYNVSVAVKKLRSIKSVDELLAFTKGEKRVTIRKVIPAAKRRLEK